MVNIFYKIAYHFFSPYFRFKRKKLFYRLFKINALTQLIDLGGEVFFWKNDKYFALPNITIVNIHSLREKLMGSMQWVVYDGFALPFKDKSFDICFCNSVFEHLGSWDKQVELAEEVRRIADKYFVQVPHKDSLINPHCPFPFFAFRCFPEKWKSFLRNIVFKEAKKTHGALLNSERFLTEDEFRVLFPYGKIVVEKFLWFSKSLIAYKT
jgi:hypothetical protein